MLTEVVLRQAQERLDEGLDTSQVAEQLGVKRDTLALRDPRRAPA